VSHHSVARLAIEANVSYELTGYQGDVILEFGLISAEPGETPS
jgi:hypothetical protein